MKFIKYDNDWNYTIVRFLQYLLKWKFFSSNIYLAYYVSILIISFLYLKEIRYLKYIILNFSPSDNLFINLLKVLISRI